MLLSVDCFRTKESHEAGPDKVWKTFYVSANSFGEAEQRVMQRLADIKKKIGMEYTIECIRCDRDSEELL